MKTDVLRSSIPLGRWFGLELRMHLSLLALLALAVGYSLASTAELGRGVGLWLALMVAIAVRELARGAALLRARLSPRAVILFPFGGILALEPGSQSRLPAANLITFPVLANLLAGLLLMGFSYAMAPGVRLLDQPWISVGHLLRSLVWMQFLVAALSLLPAISPVFLRMQADTGSGVPPARRASLPAFGLGFWISLALLLAGMVLVKPWLALLGCFAMLGAQLGRRQTNSLTAAGTVPVRNLMLTRFASLTNSDTVSEALSNSARSLQDIFPVLRGDRLVGAVAREVLAQQLRVQGDGYVQRDMQRTLHIALPGEPLAETLSQAAALGSPDFIPVAENGRVLGILTPAGISAALRSLSLGDGSASATGKARRREPREP